MSNYTVKFVLNHRACPQLNPMDFIDLAAELGMSGIELRNDVKENSITNLVTAKAVAERAAAKNIQVLTINALYPFNEWNEERQKQAEELADLCQASGAKSLVCCPLVLADDQFSENEKVRKATEALQNLAPILKSRGVKGHVEPLGFPNSTLRRKKLALKAIDEAGAADVFTLLHDNFHHAGAGETEYQAQRTGLVHISSVTDNSLAMEDILDAHRFFVQGNDITFCVEQIRDLLNAGYNGFVSFEPFADEIGEYADPATAIKESMQHIMETL